MIDAMKADQGEVVYFIEFHNIDGVSEVRFCTAGQGLDWDGHYWQPGAAINIGSISESGDMKAERVEVSVGSVDTANANSFIREVLAANTIGDKCKIWMAYMLPDGVVSDPLGAFTGYLNEDWTIEMKKKEGRKIIIVKTQVVSRIAELEEVMALRTNQQSWERFDEGPNARDWFFEFVPSLHNAKFYWGSEEPDDATTSGSTSVPPPIDS